MNLDLSIVADEAELAELVHEKTDPRSSRSDHFGQRFLADSDANGLRAGFLSEIGQQQQQSRQAFLA